MKIQITLKDIGRNKFNRSFVVENITIEQAGQIAIDECDKHLLSSDIEMVSIKRGNVLFKYGVYAGFRKVGDVELLVIEGEEGQNG